MNKYKKNITAITIGLIFFSIIYSIFKIVVNKPKNIFDYLFPLLISIILYFVLTFFIKNPQYLIKKEYNNHYNISTEKQQKAIEWWQKYYYIFRLILVLIFTLLIIFNK